MTPQDNWQAGTPPRRNTGRRAQHPPAENPFEEPEQSPELRQERSPDLYRATNPFWNQPVRDADASSAPPDLGEPPQSAPPEATVWNHRNVLDTDSYTGEEKRRKPGRRLLRVLVLLAIVAMLISLIFGVLLRVRNIRVTGNLRVSSEEIISLSKIKLGQSSLVNETEISNRIEQNPYLICKMVSLESFDTICIEVKERQEVTFITASGIGVITDAHGYVLRTVRDANESHPELVRVQGLSVRKTMTGQKLVVSQQRQLDAVTEVLLQLTVMGGLDQIAVLDVSSLDRIRMQTMDGMEIVLGDDELLHEKLRAFLIVRQELESMGETGGTLMLTDAVNPVYTPPST